MFHVKQIQGAFTVITADRQTVFDRLNVSPAVQSKLDTYVALLEEWQGKMNLVSDSTLPVVWTRHVLDSAQIEQYLQPSDKVILDLGSGAGFPALVLAILDESKSRTVHMVESDGKKCSFLQAVADACGLQVVIHNERIEKMAVFKADVITARALAALDKLVNYAKPFIGERTRCLFLKGKKADEELKLCAKKFVFAVEKHPSITSEEGRILCLTGVKKK